MFWNVMHSYMHAQFAALIAFLVFSWLNWRQTRMLIVSCPLIYDDATRACAVSTVTADRTGKIVLLTYSLTASHCSTEARLAGVPFPRSFDSRLALRQSCTEHLKSLVGCGCEKIHRFRVFIKAFLVKKKGTKMQFWAGWPNDLRISGGTAARMSQVITTLWSHTSNVEEWNRQITLI